MVSRATGAFLTWIAVYVVWIDLSFARKDQPTDEYDTKSAFKQELRRAPRLEPKTVQKVLKNNTLANIKLNLTAVFQTSRRTVDWDGCFLPLPLENGKFYPSPRRCPKNDTTAACRMVPGTPVPYNFVLYFYCDSGYMLNTSKPVSVCLNGRWRPSLPVCREGADECIEHEDCPTNRTCIVGLCADSCDGLCGPDSVCDIVNHRPQCKCKKGYVGNPFKGCIKGGPVAEKLLVSHIFEVSVIDPNAEGERLQSDLTYPKKFYLDPDNRWTSVAYHYDKKYLYFTGPDEIYRDKITDRVTRTGPPETVVRSTGDFSAKLAVDWKHDKLIWLSHRNHSIEVSDLNGRNRKTLVPNLSQFNLYSNNLVVDPFAGYIFVVNEGQILRFNLDGSNNITLEEGVRSKRNADVLTLDMRRRRVYYSSGDVEFNGFTGAFYIGSCDYDGNNRTDQHLPEIYGKWTDPITSMDFFQNALYFGDSRPVLKGHNIWKSDLTIPNHPTKTDPTSVAFFVDKNLYYLKVFHPEAQSDAS